MQLTHHFANVRVAALVLRAREARIREALVHLLKLVFGQQHLISPARHAFPFGLARVAT